MQAAVFCHTQFCHGILHNGKHHHTTSRLGFVEGQQGSLKFRQSDIRDLTDFQRTQIWLQSVLAASACVYITLTIIIVQGAWRELRARYYQDML
jgi:hypothetical protein